MTQKGRQRIDRRLLGFFWVQGLALQSRSAMDNGMYKGLKDIIW